MKLASKVSYKPIPTQTALGELANPLGLAAGYDKTGRFLRSLSKLGFGYIVAGTFTRSPLGGNPKPRVARNKGEHTLVNALGFPNPGIDGFIANLTSSVQSKVPIVASISGSTVDDILYCYSKVQPHVSGVELNLSSPNTPALKDLREPPSFAELAEAMNPARKKPTYLKVPPYAEEGEFKDTLENVKTWASLGFTGVTASNSLRVSDARMAIGTGGFSGPPLLEHTKAALVKIRSSVTPPFEINACGGVSSPADALSLLEMGATTVQVFTALVYQGPSLMRRILNDPSLRAAIEARTVRSRAALQPEGTRTSA